MIDFKCLIWCCRSIWCDGTRHQSAFCAALQRTALAATLRLWHQVAALLAALRQKGRQLHSSVTARQARSALLKWRVMASTCRLLRRRYIDSPFANWHMCAADKARRRRLLKIAVQRLLDSSLARSWQAWRAAIEVSFVVDGLPDLPDGFAKHRR